MRTELGKYKGQRIRVYGIIAAFKSYKVRNGRIVPSMLISNVCLTGSNEFLTDHVWFKKGHLWPDDIAIGSIVSFDARVVTYNKCSIKKDERHDFKLTKPSNILVV